jgi:hypothetical protein
MYLKYSALHLAFYCLVIGLEKPLIQSTIGVILYIIKGSNLHLEYEF